MQKQSHYEVYRDKKGGYRWKLVAPNGETVALGESYRSRTAVMNTVKKMGSWAATKEVREEKPRRVSKKAKV